MTVRIFRVLSIWGGTITRNKRVFLSFDGRLYRFFDIIKKRK